MLKILLIFTALLCATPCHAYSCSYLKRAVEKYGLEAVKAEAKRRGWTDDQINAEERRCNLK